MSVIKRVRLPPLDRDPTIRMLPRAFNLSRYNSLLKATCVDDDRWTASPPDPCTPMGAPFDPTLLLQPRVLRV